MKSDIMPYKYVDVFGCKIDFRQLVYISAFHKSNKIYV